MSLPSGCTELEYIESTGGQFIDTGVVPGASTKVVCEFEKSTTSNASQHIFGCDKFSFYYNRSWYTYYSESGNKVSFQGPPADGKYTVTKEMLTATMTDGTLSWSVETTSSTPSRTMLIFAKANAYGTQDFAVTKIYSLKVYNGATLVVDYRPCKDPAGAVCMYDVMSGEYGYNAGTGAFVAGPAISEPEPQPPAAPTNLRATVSGTTVTLTWDASVGAVGYKLYRDNVLIAFLAGTSFSETLSEGRTYTYTLAAYNSYGVSTAVSLSVNVPHVAPSLELITDRTQADVARAKYLTGLWDPEQGWTGTPEELAEWLDGLKGAYNASDLNRVGAAVRYVSDRLTGCGYLVQVAPKTDWTVADIPTAAQLAAYLADVAELRGKLAVLPTTPETPVDMIGLTYTEANDIEKILEDVDRLITLMMQSYYYSGELFAGEV